MNHLIGPLSLVGILSTAMVYGTDIPDCRPSRSQVRFAVGRNRSHGIHR
jgi:hypothetical protein